MSADYVRSVFDQYARKFDDALEALSYSAPQMLADSVEACMRGAQSGRMQFGTMLDLGCGTGLSGEAFRPVVDWMEGVDLSPGMIEQARKKNLYDKLDVGDLDRKPRIDRLRRRCALQPDRGRGCLCVLRRTSTLIATMVAQRARGRRAVRLHRGNASE